MSRYAIAIGILVFPCVALAGLHTHYYTSDTAPGGAIEYACSDAGELSFVNVTEGQVVPVVRAQFQAQCDRDKVLAAADAASAARRADEERRMQAAQQNILAQCRRYYQNPTDRLWDDKEQFKAECRRLLNTPGVPGVGTGQLEVCTGEIADAQNDAYRLSREAGDAVKHGWNNAAVELYHRAQLKLNEFQRLRREHPDLCRKAARVAAKGLASDVGASNVTPNPTVGRATNP